MSNDRDSCETCPHERVHRVEYQLLTENLNEVKARVARVETTLGRGVLLLVANLMGVAMSLMKTMAQG